MSKFTTISLKNLIVNPENPTLENYILSASCIVLSIGLTFFLFFEMIFNDIHWVVPFSCIITLLAWSYSYYLSRFSTKQHLLPSLIFSFSTTALYILLWFSFDDFNSSLTTALPLLLMIAYNIFPKKYFVSIIIHVTILQNSLYLVEFFKNAKTFTTDYTTIINLIIIQNIVTFATGILMYIIKQSNEENKLRLNYNESKLTQQQDRFKRLIDALKNDYFVMEQDKHGRIVFLSEAAANIIGVPYQDCVSILQDVINQQKWRISANGGKIITLSTPEKGEVILQCHQQVFSKNNAGIANIESLIENVTQKVQHENKLSRSLLKEKMINDAKDNLLTTISHQFRTPLTILKTNTILLNKISDTKEIDPNRLKSITLRVDGACKRMHNMLEEVMEYTRLQLGPKLILTSCSLVELVRETINTLKKQMAPYQTDNLQVLIKIEGTEKLAELDMNLVTHILYHTISNAIKFTVKNSPPSLNIEFLEKNILITIIDNGIGIPESEQTGLFKQFFRAKNADTFPGLGIGLHLTSQLLEMLEGSIQLHSKEGIGTKVSITLPYELKNKPEIPVYSRRKDEIYS
ncbi:HAMP domain-containing sensor histidine kinase [Limibacter armeniacum]|uniref:sensor histidine kinase n=1 Tax=Limibacter armeniacum TaxID=466084 RepID=UPI002FE5CBAF